MFFMVGIYWDIFYKYQKAYFKRKYIKLPQNIYYDRKFKLYVNPKIIDELVDGLYVCSETVHSGLFISMK